jgi:anti-anti-sigma factor
VLAGRVAHASSRALDEQVSGLLGAGNTRLVMDFSGVDYVSSAGLQVVGRAAASAKAAGGALVVTGLSDPVRLAFDLAGTLAAVAIEDSRESAIERAIRQAGRDD